MPISRRPWRGLPSGVSLPFLCDKVFALCDEISGDKQFRKSNAARGSEHGIYINRTFFGLYNLLHQMGAEVETDALKRKGLWKKAS